MTGGLGFVKDGTNNQKSNRRMVKDLHDKHFKSSSPKSDFSRKFRERNKADAVTLEAIKKRTISERRKSLIKSLVLMVVAVTIVVVIYFLPKLLDI